MAEKKIYDKHDIMMIFGISNPTLTRWIRDKKIPKPFKFGDNNSTNRWLKEDIDRFTNEKAANQTTNP